jgi:hypothetical protein
MEMFLPSVFLMLVAYLFTMMFIPKLSHLVILVGAIAFIAVTAFNHYSMFANEYKIMTWADTAKQFGPTLMIILIIVLMGGYIMYISGAKGTANLPMPPANIPPPETATNFVTNAIGQGLVAAGATNVNRSPNAPKSANVRTNIPIANTAHMGVAESVLSKAP